MAFSFSEDLKPSLQQNEQSPATIRPAYLDMYEISGQDPITKHSFDRYQKDKEQDARIQHYIRYGDTRLHDLGKSLEQLPTDAFITRLNNARISEKIKYIQMMWNSDDVFKRDVCRKMQERIPTLIALGLKSTDAHRQLEYAQATALLNKREDRELLEPIITAQIRNGLQSTNSETQKIATRMIVYANATDALSLVAYVFKKCPLEVQKLCAELLHQYLITFEPETDDDFTTFHTITASLVNNTKRALAGPDIEAQKIASQMLRTLPEENILPLLYQGLESPSAVVRIRCASIIPDVPESHRSTIRSFVSDKVWKDLKSSDREVQRRALPLIHYADGLLTTKRKMFSYALGLGFGNELVMPPLYAAEEIDSEHFARKKFQKTGSGTTLIGGPLKGKTIIRHIGPEEFVTWQKLYEQHELWQASGFDYVPIEPIHSYRFNDNGIVDVYTGVLDINLDQWQNMSFRFGDELERMRSKIIDVLEAQGVTHGHPHERNFCLRFWRDDAGNVDFKRVPRLYLIDFDLAQSS